MTSDSIGLAWLEYGFLKLSVGLVGITCATPSRCQKWDRSAQYPGQRRRAAQHKSRCQKIKMCFLFFSFFEEKRMKRIENEEVLRCGWNDQLMLYPKSIAFYTFFPLFSFTRISFFLFFPVTRPTREIKKTKIGDEKERGKRAKGL